MADDGRIELAYCPEIKNGHDSIVDIDEARRAFFVQDPRREFTFFCSDPDCRRRISAANYNADNFIKSPHYRRIKAHQHIPECQWNTYETDHKLDTAEIKNRTLIWEPGMTNYLRRFAHADHRDIVDRFMPQGYPFNDGHQRRSFIPRRQPNHNRMETLGRYKQTTTAFYRLVEAFRQLTPDEKDSTMVELPDNLGYFQYLSYRQAFVHVRRLWPGRVDAKVFYGSARVESIQGGYLIKFRNKSPNFAPDQPNTQAAVFIDSNAEMSRYSRHTLLPSLENYAAQRMFCCAYIYGVIAQELASFSTRYGEEQKIAVQPYDLDSINLVDANMENSFDCDECGNISQN